MGPFSNFISLKTIVNNGFYSIPFEYLHEMGLKTLKKGSLKQGRELATLGFCCMGYFCGLGNGFFELFVQWHSILHKGH
ncbi:hypothetical protein AT246_07650 [Bartonella henselae]|nr:hypothetical protein BhenCHDE101_07235 [Bartonella henselae]ETS06073.1 hypothetical protein Q654_01405 [Bartonella henselae JK 50]ETS07258.1 hypothetical protein Q655_01356 [Bartonella henselae JK 51]ETS10986.1 hypothetical protein Q653_00427 [Bartonella henselae JK 42]ETS14665.1 hypothetical protein Q652_00561 [Bartonella henselae JK 41]KEC60357.1 hypothetical protein O95_00425 [Bartonella henselae JK 53]KEC60358.1 hypothetical protein O97_00039 [Bartonella henselae str. Zeus]PNM38960.1 